MILKQKQIKLLFLIATLFITGCNNDGVRENIHPDNKEISHEDEHSNEVYLTENQITIMGIETGKLAMQNISGYIKVNGEVIINPDYELRVGTIVPGRIRKIYVKEGSFVKAGQTLGNISKTRN